MREARKNHGLVVVNNRIYAVGGQGALGNKTSPGLLDSVVEASVEDVLVCVFS